MDGPEIIMLIISGFQIKQHITKELCRDNFGLFEIIYVISYIITDI